MTTIKQACRSVRSKNAGPFWVTIDLFFTEKAYARYRDSKVLSPELLHRIYGADPKLVKRIAVDALHMIKLSYPRKAPQGGIVERDMHAGQQYVRLLDVELN